jgi:hypothetical protein
MLVGNSLHAANWGGTGDAATPRIWQDSANWASPVDVPDTTGEVARFPDTLADGQYFVTIGGSEVVFGSLRFPGFVSPPGRRL